MVVETLVIPVTSLFSIPNATVTNTLIPFLSATQYAFAARLPVPFFSFFWL